MSVIVLAEAAKSGSDFDWTKLIGIPSAIVAVLVLAAYFVGFIRPIAVQAPSYWHDGNRTRIMASIKNRSLMYDRNIEGIMVLKVPRFWKRTFTRQWRTKAQAVDLVPWGDLPRRNNPVKLTKREVRSIEFELRAANGTPKTVTLDDSFRIEARSGKRHSRSKKIDFTDVVP